MRKTAREEEFITQTMLALRSIMKEERVSRAELARRLNVHRTNSGTYFKGTDMRLSRVARAATALGYRAKVVFEHE